MSDKENWEKRLEKVEKFWTLRYGSYIRPPELMVIIREEINSARQAEKEKVLGIIERAIDNYFEGLVVIPFPELTKEELKADLKKKLEDDNI